MDQVSSLSDMLLKGPSVLGGVFPPTGGTEGGCPAQEDSFSCLVSETSALVKPLATPLSETTALEPSASSLPAVASDETDTPAVFDDVAQSASDLAAALQELLALLRFSPAAVQPPPTEATEQITDAALLVAETREESLSAPEQLLAPLSAIVDNLTEAAEIVEDSDSPVALKPLSDAIAELLVLMQLVVQALQQNPVTEGGVSEENAVLSINSSVEAANALITETRLSVAPSDLPNISVMPPMESLADVSRRFYDLLQTAETTAKQVLEVVTQVCAETAAEETNVVETTTTTTVAETAATTTVVSDTTVSLAQIEGDIQAALVHLKQKIEHAPATKPDASLAQVSAETPAPLAAAASEKTQEALKPLPATTVAEQAPLSMASVAAKPTETKTTRAETSEKTSVKTDALAEIKPSTTALSVDKAAADITKILSKHSRADASRKNDLVPELNWFGNNDGDPSLSETDSGLASSLTAEGAQAKGVYGFASTLSAFRATHGGLTGLPTVVDQVILHMNRNVKNGESQMSLQLQPSDLGKISVKLDFGSDGKVQGSVVVENPKTLEMLQKDSRSLERALQDAGLRAEPGSLQFSLSEQQDPNNPGHASEGAGKNSGNDAGDGTISAENSNAGIVDIGAISETYYITPTGVNIRV